MVRLVLAHLRKDKAVLTIFLLIITLGCFLMQIGLMASNYGNIFDAEAKREDLADYIVLAGSYTSEIDEVFDTDASLKSHTTSDIVTLNSFDLTVSKTGKNLNGTGLIINKFDPSDDSVRYIDRDDSVKGEKIYLDMYLAYFFNLNIGDTLKVKSNYGDTDYTVAGIYQDLFFGNSYVFYSVMVDDAEFQRLSEIRDESVMSGEVPSYNKLVFANTKEGKDIDLCLKDSMEKLAGECGAFSNGYTRIESRDYYTAIVNILSGFIAAFAILVMAICIIIIIFTINNNINRDVTNIGALKAVGYTVRQIRMSLMAEYISISMIGSVIGIAGGYIFFPMLEEKFIRNITGIVWDNRFYPKMSFGILAGVIVLIILTTFISTMRIRKLSPATALRFGFKSKSLKRNPLPLADNGGNLDVLLALKSFIQSRAQNFILVTVMFSLTFVATFSCVLFYNTKVDISKFQRMVLGDVADAYFYVNDESSEAVSDTIRNLKKIDGVTDAYGLSLSYGYIGEKGTNIAYTNDPQATSYDIYKGVQFRDKDETVMGISLADELGVDVGDTIDLTYGNKTVTLKITGLQQSALNRRVYIHEKAAKDLGINVTYNYIRVNVKDATAEKVDDILNKGLAIGDDNIKSAENSYRFQRSSDNMPVFAVGFVVLIISVLIALTVYLVIRLLLKTVFVKREKEFGIKKALGFTSNQLRIQLSLSLIPATAISAVAGAIMGYLGINGLFAVVLSNYGIKRSHLIVRPELSVISAVVVISLVFVMSFIMSRKMKKISAYKLMQE
ncbi:MAG: FtsX-like permease family protein [Clostridiales bacterium]|nr:FtsX-like permease family protein [Clostridiales bacterium]